MDNTQGNAVHLCTFLLVHTFPFLVPRLVAVVQHISRGQVDSAKGNAVHVVHTFLVPLSRLVASVQDMSFGQVDNAWGNAVHLVHTFLVPSFRLVAVVRHISSSQVDNTQGNAVHLCTFLLVHTCSDLHCHLEMVIRGTRADRGRTSWVALSATLQTPALLPDSPALPFLSLLFRLRPIAAVAMGRSHLSPWKDLVMVTMATARRAMAMAMATPQAAP